MPSKPQIFALLACVHAILIVLSSNWLYQRADAGEAWPAMFNAAAILVNVLFFINCIRQVGKA